MVAIHFSNTAIYFSKSEHKMVTIHCLKKASYFYPEERVMGLIKQREIHAHWSSRQE
jgi:GTP cyclohydrolase I